LGRLFGVKTSAEMDRPVATKFMKSLLAPKARQSHQSLGGAPQGYENQKNISAESAIHFRDTSWISAY
jgi:hypothetical protein